MKLLSPHFSHLVQLPFLLLHPFSFSPPSPHSVSSSLFSFPSLIPLLSPSSLPLSPPTLTFSSSPPSLPPSPPHSSLPPSHFISHFSFTPLPETSLLLLFFHFLIFLLLLPGLPPSPPHPFHLSLPLTFQTSYPALPLSPLLTSSLSLTSCLHFLSPIFSFPVTSCTELCPSFLSWLQFRFNSGSGHSQWRQIWVQSLL